MNLIEKIYCYGLRGCKIPRAKSNCNCVGLIYLEMNFSDCVENADKTGSNLVQKYVVRRSITHNNATDTKASIAPLMMLPCSNVSTHITENALLA